MSEVNILNAEAPVAVAWEKAGVCASCGVEGHVSMWPLSPCCGASGKGGGDGVVCRKCYGDLPAGYGDCWEPDGSDPLLRHGFKWAREGHDGWRVYRDLLVEELLARQWAAEGRMMVASEHYEKADALVAEARRQYEEAVA